MKPFIQTMYLIILFCLSGHSILRAQATVNDSVALIKQNYLNALISKDQGKKEIIKSLSAIAPQEEVSDQNVIELQQQYPISPKEIAHLIKSLNEDGSWTDINYNDTKRSGWEPKIHAERILKLTKYYMQQKQSLPLAESSQITNSIHKAMAFWFARKLVCKNWWYNQIGIPRTLGAAFLLFEQEMSEQERQEAIKVMLNSKFGMTGQNKVWLAGNVLLRALLQNDWELIKEAQAIIGSEIVLGQKEGIKDDWSFHQHGAQQQFGNYGLSFLCNMSFYSEIFAGTSLAFSPEQQKILTSLLLEGYQWIVWRGYWDVNALNRQLFKNADIDKVFSLSFAASSLLKGSESAVAEKIRKMIRRNSLANSSPNTFTGNKHFRESDYTLHRTPRWMASLRMASNRVIGTELVNEDNLKGYYMADGALYTYVHGDEYHNIFPFWNWRRIPGITTYESDAPIPDPNRTDSGNKSSFVHGTSYEGTGITAMQLNRNGLTANKAWIFTNNYILCIGGNIQSDSTATILTSIDQRFRKGKVWSHQGRRFFHDNTGYILLQADTCVALTEKKQGQWHDFMGMYEPKMLEDEIFSIYIKHRKEQPGTYAYLILPGSSQKLTKNFKTDDIRILQNDEKMQAVIIGKLCYVAAYQETNIALAGKEEIHIPQPGTYIIDVESGKFKGSTESTSMKSSF